MSFLSKLLKRSEIRYVIAGCATFLIDNLVFNFHMIFPAFGPVLFGKYEFKEMLFNVLGMIAGLIFGFIVNRNWSFKATGNVSKQFFRCLMLFVFNMLVSSIAVGMLNSLIQNDLILAALRLTVSIMIGIWNYFAYKLFVYK